MTVSPCPAVFSYLAEQHLRHDNDRAAVGQPATVTANLTTAGSLPKAQLPEMSAPVPSTLGGQIPQPQVVNLSKKQKTSSTPRFLKCLIT